MKGLAVDRDGNLLLADIKNNEVRRVDARTGIITRFAGTGSATGSLGDGGLAINASVGAPISLAIDPFGNVLIGQTFRIRKVNAISGAIQTVAGSGVRGYSGDDGLAVRANINSAYGLAADAAGNFFLSDSRNNRIRRVDGRTGIISTVAGTGDGVRPSEGEPAKLAPLLQPLGISVDFSGGLLIAEGANAKIRRIDLLTGFITTVAGTGESGFGGDNGPAAAASFVAPDGVVADPAGNIFILDKTNNRVRMVSAGSRIITTVAGNGVFGFSGDGGPAVEASLFLQADPNFEGSQLATDSAGNILFPDSRNNRIRKIDRGSGIITTVAGNGQQGFSGDGGPATSASLNQPRGVTVDSAGNLFIADTSNTRIRKVDVRTGVISTIAGGGL